MSTFQEALLQNCNKSQLTAHRHSGYIVLQSKHQIRRSGSLKIRRSREKSQELQCFQGGLAQLVRAPASHAGGHWFESSSLHHMKPQNRNGSRAFLFADIFQIIEITTKIRHFFKLALKFEVVGYKKETASSQSGFFPFCSFLPFLFDCEKCFS